MVVVLELAHLSCFYMHLCRIFFVPILFIPFVFAPFFVSFFLLITILNMTSSQSFSGLLTRNQIVPFLVREYNAPNDGGG